MNIFLEVGLPISLAFIMFAMGLTLTLEDFKRIFVMPKAFILGMFLQVILLPIFGFAIAYIWHNYFGLSALMAVGLIIIAACPGGITSNLLVFLGRGDSALSVSLTGVISCLSVITLPVFVALAFKIFLKDSQEVELNLVGMVLGIFLISTVPLIVGMLVKAWKNNFALSTEKIFKRVSSIVFVLLVIVIMIDNRDLFITHVGFLGPMVMTLCCVTMLFALGTAKLLGLEDKQQRAITFECGLQNSTVAIFITLTLFQNEEMMLPAGAYGILMYLPSALYLWFLYNKDKRTSV